MEFYPTRAPSQSLSFHCICQGIEAEHDTRRPIAVDPCRDASAWTPSDAPASDPSAMAITMSFQSHITSGEGHQRTDAAAHMDWEASGKPILLGADGGSSATSTTDPDASDASTVRSERPSEGSWGSQSQASNVGE